VRGDKRLECWRLLTAHPAESIVRSRHAERGDYLEDLVFTPKSVNLAEDGARPRQELVPVCPDEPLLVRARPMEDQVHETESTYLRICSTCSSGSSDTIQWLAAFSRGRSAVRRSISRRSSTPQLGLRRERQRRPDPGVLHDVRAVGPKETSTSIIFSI